MKKYLNALGRVLTDLFWIGITGIILLIVFILTASYIGVTLAVVAGFIIGIGWLVYYEVDNGDLSDDAADNKE